MNGRKGSKEKFLRKFERILKIGIENESKRKEEFLIRRKMRIEENDEREENENRIGKRRNGKKLKKGFRVERVSNGEKNNK